MLANRCFLGAQKGKASAIIFSRCASSHVHADTTAVVPKEPVVDVAPGYFKRIAMRWNGIPIPGETHPPQSMFRDCDKEFVVPKPLPKVSKDYKEYPERDLVNFPYPEEQAYTPKTRLFMIPDSWLAPFHKVTGTSGPYLFLGGVTAFLLNKEIFVMEENAMKIFGFWAGYWLLSRTVQYRLDQYMYKLYNEKLATHQKVIDDDLKEAVEFRKTSAAEAESLAAVQEKFPVIFKENLALQLEALYRKNVNAVATELKRRLDYLHEVENTKLRFEREILLKSITEGVLKQIQNNEGNFKENYLDTCILQLKSLAR